MPKYLHQLLEAMEARRSIRSVIDLKPDKTFIDESYKVFVARTLRELYEMGHVQIFMPIQTQA